MVAEKLMHSPEPLTAGELQDLLCEVGRIYGDVT